MNVKEEHFCKFNLYVCYPDNYDPNKIYPAIIHFHGAGNREFVFGSEESYIALRNMFEGKKPLENAIVFVPHCVDDTWYIRFNDVLDMVDYCYSRKDVDKAKFNGSGVSMGGYCLYSVLMSKPELFHKAFVCCGGGMYWNAGRMKNIEFRIYHGMKDCVVYPEEGQRMYEKLIENGTKAELFLLPENDHNCWDYAFNDIKGLQWLIS